MRIAEVELRRVTLPLRTPFTTAFGTQEHRDVLLVAVETSDGARGWGECVALSTPVYSSEHVDGAAEVIRRFLLPPLLAAGDVTAAGFAGLVRHVHGHRMAKAAVEAALLDAELRTREVSLAAHLGAVRDRVDCGVSVGIPADLGELVETVARHLDEGYLRVKLKIRPGWDLEPVAAVRERLGDGVRLQVDANCGYGPDDADHLAALDDFGLELVEQPYPAERLRAHAELAARMRTPICLDESLTSAVATEDAIALGACEVVNVKAGRVGGYLEAVAVHDVAVAAGVPVWCGGMLETGIGRAANLALAALPGFTLPGDTSASDRYWERDLTEPFLLAPDGTLTVPTGPGIGVDPLPDVLEEVTTAVERIRP